MENRLIDLITGKNVDCCGKCRYFEKDDDALQTKSFGYCNYLNYEDISTDELSEGDEKAGVFSHEYCENFSPLNPYNNDQVFYIALFKDKSYYYFKYAKPNDFERYPCGKKDDEVNLIFDLPTLKISNLQATSYLIDNKLPNSIHDCSYVISMEDNELELKDILVKYILHKLEENIQYYENELKETRSDYTFYSKFLRERNF